jgi:hypothetical protein
MIQALELTFAILGICITIACLAYVVVGVIAWIRWK